MEPVRHGGMRKMGGRTLTLREIQSVMGILMLMLTIAAAAGSEKEDKDTPDPTGKPTLL